MEETITTYQILSRDIQKTTELGHMEHTENKSIHSFGGETRRKKEHLEDLEVGEKPRIKSVLNVITDDVKFALEQAIKAQTESKDIALLFL